MITKISEKENPFLKRKEIMFQLGHGSGATPSKAVLQEYVAKEFNADKEKVDVREIISERGSANSKAKVFIWEEKPKERVKKEKKKKAEKKKAAAT